MQASFTPQEQELIGQLKDKYGGIKVDQSATGEEGEDASSQCSVGTSGLETAVQAQPSRPPVTVRASSEVEASICGHCHGTGTLVEIYNHRRLENYCKECDGRGVRVFKNGVEVVQGGAARGEHTSSGAQGATGVLALHSREATERSGAGDAAGGSSSKDEATESTQAAALQQDVKRIASKIASYTKERLDTLAVLQQPCDSGTDPAGRERAARDLIAQLDLQLERLELARRKKEATMDRLRAGQGRAAALTMDDIIANEGARP